MGLIQAFTLLCLLGAVRAQSGYPRDRLSARQLFNPLGRPILDDDVIGDEIPGVAGVDYPVLASVPITDFRCDELPYPGYYADQQAYCQAFYICERGGRGTGFLCPNGTLFNQEFLVCDWWNHVDCARALDFYSVNADVVRAMEEVDAAKLSRSPLDGSVFYNSRGEPLSPARIPGASAYNPIGLDRAFVSPAVRSRLGNRYPTNLGRLPNAALLSTTPRPVLGFPNAFNNYRPLNGLGPVNNKYTYRPLNGLSPRNNYAYRPQSALNNRYPYRPQNTLGAFNNRYPSRPQNTLGASDNRYPSRPQGPAGALDNGYTYDAPGVGNAFNNGFNSLDGRNNNANGVNEGNRDSERNGNDNGEYNQGNGNGVGGNDGVDNGKYSKNNKKGAKDAGRNISDKKPQGGNGETYRNDNGNTREYNSGERNGEGNGADQGNDRYRDDNGSEEGYSYDRPKNEFKGESQVFGIVDPSKSYLPPLK